MVCFLLLALEISLMIDSILCFCLIIQCHFGFEIYAVYPSERFHFIYLTCELFSCFITFHSNEGKLSFTWGSLYMHVRMI